MSRSWKSYSPAWAHAQAVRARASRLQRQGLLSAAQHAAIDAAHPLDYYRPVWPLRLGLFVFTCLAVGLSFGLVALATFQAPVAAGVVAAIGCLALAELFIRKQRAYYAGVDNALLYCGLSAAVGTLWYALWDWYALWNTTYPSIVPGLNAATPALFLGLSLTLALLLLAVARYAEPLVTAAAYATAVLLLLELLLATLWGLLVLPLALMGFGLAAYALHQRLRARVDAAYYAPALLVLKALALATFYFGGNYLVFRESSASLNILATSEQIAVAPFFYVSTAAIPLVYLWWGLRRADRTVLLLGGFTLAFSLFTLRYYRSVLPPEWAATLGGAMLIAATGAALRYLRPQRHGLTSVPDDEPRFLNLEALIVTETANVPAAPGASGFAFGGGESGGGGATGSF